MPPTDAPTEPEVRRQLDAILAHDLFRRSARLQRFLRVIVDWTLAGHAAALNERALGIAVFDRGPAHDPRIDPIVRVEARRLRGKLKAYYLRAGETAPLVIALRPGSYAPTFCRRSSGPPAPRAKPLVFVTPFESRSRHPSVVTFCAALTEEVIHLLTRAGARVMAWNPGPIAAPCDTTYVVTAGVASAGGHLRVRAQCVELPAGTCVASATVDRREKDLLALPEDIAQALVSTFPVLVGQASGARSLPIRVI
jgi:serine/threonine-protein kinase